jgi:ABC-type Na+ efflux pump permease subunit
MTPEEAKIAASAAFVIASLIFWVVLFVGLAVGNGFIAARLKKSVALWVILTLIPVYNLFFMYYVGFYVVGRVLHRLNQIAEQVEVRGVSS